jgi:hypothetical protein
LLVRHFDSPPIDVFVGMGVKVGGWDDALHLTAAEGDTLTLCKQGAASRNVEALVGDIEVDPYAICWTCSGEARRLLKEREAQRCK